MLHQISWQQYLITIIGLSLVYYLFVGITYCRADLYNFFRRFTGKRENSETTNSDTDVTTSSVMGVAAAEHIIPEDDDLVFGEPEYADDDVQVGNNESTQGESDLPNPDHLQMTAEVTTLFGVVQESGESKANFEMVFRLLAQKYHALANTRWQEKINGHLLSLGTLPFPLTAAELDQYWNN